MSTITNVDSQNNINIYKLSNKIRVVFEQNRHLNSVTAGVWINVGSRDENVDNNGIAHMIEHMLFKGTKNMSAEELAIKTAIIGGGLNAYTSKENTEYYCKTLPSHLKEAIDILGDMICNPLMDENDLEREKSVVCEEIDMYKDSAEDSVHEILQKKVWKKHPLGYLISGRKKIVKSYTVSQLKDFMAQYYTGENIVISVAGNFNKRDTLKWIQQAFGDIKSESERNPEFRRTTPVYEKAVFSKEKDIEQLHMNMAFSAPSFMDEERYTAILLNAILGGDVNSRLFQQIREKQGLTYSVCSYGSSFSDTGLIHIYAAMNYQQKDKVFQSITDIIKSLNQSGVTKEELENAKKQTIVEMSLNRDSTSSLMSNNAKSIIYDLPLRPFADKVERINNVNKKDIDNFIEKYLDIEKMSIGMIGPKSCY